MTPPLPGTEDSGLPIYSQSRAHATAFLPHTPDLPEANLGLWFTRFYSGYNTIDWTVAKEKKTEFIQSTVSLAQKQGREGQRWVEVSCKRLANLCKSLDGICRELVTSGPMVTGTGLNHPVENGFTFHPTLGVPYLPASGVKGLLRAWMTNWADGGVSLAEDWFGGAASAEEQDKEVAGSLIFFDALPTQWMRLECDILTPHMSDWYEKGGAISKGRATEPPADWHSPVPSPFLVIAPETHFQLAIAPRLTGDPIRDAAAKAAVSVAMNALVDALDWIGFGAKTAAGYGRMYDLQARRAAEEVANATRLQHELKDAGIQTDEVEWPNAKVTWEKGKGELSVLFSGKRGIARGQEAQKLREQLSEQQRSKLTKGKDVQAKARVKIRGNDCTILSLTSPATDA